MRLEPVTEPVPVLAAGGRRGGVNARFVVAAWTVGLCGVVGLAAAGRLAEPATEPRTAAIAFGPPVRPAARDGSAAQAPAGSVIARPEIVVMSSPAEANMTITTRELVVQGFLQTGTGTVRVTLEARGNRMIDDATVTPSLARWKRPGVDRHAEFEVRFGLPNPRPNGRMIVQVAAYDWDGTLIDVVRRPIRVGPLLERAVGAAAWSRPAD